MASRDITPFIGLRPFEEDDASLFFGRQEQKQELLTRLASEHFVAVVGGSGCGKSSLVRAGLTPIVRGGFLLRNRQEWSVATFTPGSDPYASLASALTAAAPGTPVSSEALQREGDFGLVASLGEHLSQSGNLLVVIDQFEELFRAEGASAPDAELMLKAQFVRAMLELADAATRDRWPVYVVITMRADHIGDCEHTRGLAEKITRSIYVVPQLGPSECEEAIVGPIRRAGGDITPRLLDRVLSDYGALAGRLDESEGGDALPLLQHALMRAWDVKSAEGAVCLDLPHYTHDTVGGIVQALDLDAERALAEARQRGLDGLVEHVFRCLTETDASNRRVRRATSLATLALVARARESHVREALACFRRRRRNFVRLWPGADRRLDISHESVIRRWRRLAGWAATEYEAAEAYRQLVRGSVAYEDTGVLWEDRTTDHWFSRVVHWQLDDPAIAAWATRVRLPEGRARTWGVDEALRRSTRFLDASRRAESARIEHERLAEERQRQVERNQIAERARAEGLRHQLGRTRLALTAAAVLMVGVVALGAWRSHVSRELQAVDRARTRLLEERSGGATAADMLALQWQQWSASPGEQDVLVAAIVDDLLRTGGESVVNGAVSADGALRSEVGPVIERIHVLGTGDSASLIGVGPTGLWHVPRGHRRWARVGQASVGGVTAFAAAGDVAIIGDASGNVVVVGPGRDGPALTVRLRLDDAVTALALAPDGRALLAGTGRSGPGTPRAASVLARCEDVADVTSRCATVGIDDAIAAVRFADATRGIVGVRSEPARGPGLVFRRWRSSGNRLLIDAAPRRASALEPAGGGSTVVVADEFGGFFRMRLADAWTRPQEVPHARRGGLVYDPQRALTTLLTWRDARNREWIAGAEAATGNLLLAWPAADGQGERSSAMRNPSGAPTKRLVRHPDNMWLAQLTSGGTIDLWSIAGDPGFVATLEHPFGAIVDTVFIRDQLFAATERGVVQRWSLGADGTSFTTAGPGITRTVSFGMRVGPGEGAAAPTEDGGGAGAPTPSISSTRPASGTCDAVFDIVSDGRSRLSFDTCAGGFVRNGALVPATARDRSPVIAVEVRAAMALAATARRVHLIQGSPSRARGNEGMGRGLLGSATAHASEGLPTAGGRGVLAPGTLDRFSIVSLTPDGGVPLVSARFGDGHAGDVEATTADRRRVRWSIDERAGNSATRLRALVHASLCRTLGPERRELGSCTALPVWNHEGAHP